MTAADLREWIGIFMMDLRADGAGGGIETVPSGLIADRPANARTATPRRVFSGDQLADRIDQVFTIRYEPGITSAYRVMWRDQLWDISRVRNVDNADAWLELTCERREAGAQ